MSLKTLGITFLLYTAAALAEIGGGWLIWQWIRVKQMLAFGLAGGVLLVLYGVLATLQPENEFGRVYVIYGALFMVFSLIWGILVDGWLPLRRDFIGVLIVLIGVAVMLLG